MRAFRGDADELPAVASGPFGHVKFNRFNSGKIKAPGSKTGSRALEQPSPRTAHAANLGALFLKGKET